MLCAALGCLELCCAAVCCAVQRGVVCVWASVGVSLACTVSPACAPPRPSSPCLTLHLLLLSGLPRSFSISGHTLETTPKGGGRPPDEHRSDTDAPGTTPRTWGRDSAFHGARDDYPSQQQLPTGVATARRHPCVPVVAGCTPPVNEETGGAYAIRDHRRPPSPPLLGGGGAPMRYRCPPANLQRASRPRRTHRPRRRRHLSPPRPALWLRRR